MELTTTKEATVDTSGDRCQNIRAFVLQYAKQDNLDDSVNMFETGFVNSLFTMQLIQFVEKKFDLTVEDDDLDIENFKSINAISEFIARKKN